MAKRRSVVPDDGLTEAEMNQQRGVPDVRPQRWSIKKGMVVSGTDGAEIGEVKAVRRSDFLVNRPMAFDTYVPLDAVLHTTNDEVVLAIAADEVDSMGWANPGLPGLDGPPPPAPLLR